ATLFRSPVDKSKAALEAKRKMMVVTALDKATITIDGDYLRVAYAPKDADCKTQIESRDKRIAIEDACEQVLGRRLTLLASISGAAEIAAIAPERSDEPRSNEPAAAKAVRTAPDADAQVNRVGAASERRTQQKE